MSYSQRGCIDTKSVTGCLILSQRALSAAKRISHMRYELRRYTDISKTDYVVRQTSDDYEAINKQYNRAFFASTAPNLLHIVDTKKQNNQ